jgi:hypothetical protein
VDALYPAVVLNRPGMISTAPAKVSAATTVSAA